MHISILPAFLLAQVAFSVPVDVAPNVNLIIRAVSFPYFPHHNLPSHYFNTAKAFTLTRRNHLSGTRPTTPATGTTRTSTEKWARIWMSGATEATTLRTPSVVLCWQMRVWNSTLTTVPIVVASICIITNLSRATVVMISLRDSRVWRWVLYSAYRSSARCPKGGGGGNGSWEEGGD